MLPLAIILKGMGYKVSGSDRSMDQGRTPDKFAWIEGQGITLYPQDGSGVRGDIAAVIISKAVESTVPDIAAAQAANIPVRKRVDMLIELFNDARLRIAISGTSGKTTTTGMTGFILKEAGVDPTVMNGGIFRNYMQENPYSTAFVGGGGVFVTEVDESDGIDAVCRFDPDVAVIHNISLDHQPMEELQKMFSGFLSKTRNAIINADDPVIVSMAKDYAGTVTTYGFMDGADMRASNILYHPDGVECRLTFGGEIKNLRLRVPGRHNISNAMAALCAAHAASIPFTRAVDLLSGFTGIRRRMEVVGTQGGITVMDDFAHNPDKIAATLTTLHEFRGPLQIFFQPHGYGFLKVVGEELSKSFAEHMADEDRLYMVEPFYAGGTVDRSVGSASIVDAVCRQGRKAYLMEDRSAVKKAILEQAVPGHRIIVMGARDDTLSLFASEILRSLKP